MTTKDRSQPMYTGPWLDRMFPVYLRDGRMASVTGFSVLPSNTGIFEGGMFPEANAMQRNKIRALAKERYGSPIVEVEPAIVPLPEVTTPLRPRERLPWMACVAHLTSEPLDADMLASTLTVVWWQDAFTLPLPQEIERAVAAVDWARAAEDYDFG